MISVKELTDNYDPSIRTAILAALKENEHAISMTCGARDTIEVIINELLLETYDGFRHELSRRIAEALESV